MNVSFIPEYICECGKKLDASTGVSHEHKPKEGDLSVCLYCGRLHIFNKDLTRRTPTEIELMHIKMDPAWIQIKTVQDAIRAQTRH